MPPGPLKNPTAASAGPGRSRSPGRPLPCGAPPSRRPRPAPRSPRPQQERTGAKGALEEDDVLLEYDLAPSRPRQDCPISRGAFQRHRQDRLLRAPASRQRDRLRRRARSHRAAGAEGPTLPRNRYPAVVPGLDARNNIAGVGPGVEHEPSLSGWRPRRSPDPDYEGILSTLRACLSQTSQYPWETLVGLVEHKFPKCRAWLRLQRSLLKRLSPNTLLAAMDYLYLVQSLPEDRFMMIDNQMGLVPMVIWANCILGLRVLVQDSPDGDVVFGDAGNPQVIVKWSEDWQLYEAELASPPTVCLLDGGMDVVLTTSPDENEAVQLEGEERHRLEGYGTTFLRRLFNRTTIVADNHAIYQETAQFAIAFAIALSRAMRHIPFPARELTAVPPQCCRSTEIWQIKDSGHVFPVESGWTGVLSKVMSIASLWRMDPGESLQLSAHT